MQEPVFCQSCMMPMQNPQDFGTEQNGEKSPDYCAYCYQNGAFLQNCTMEEMVEFCLKMAEEQGFYENCGQAKAQMLAYFPTLKRWKA